MLWQLNDRTTKAKAKHVGVYSVPYVCVCVYRYICIYRNTQQKPNSWRYNFVEISGIILRVLRLNVSLYNVYITNLKPLLLKGGGGG